VQHRCEKNKVLAADESHFNRWIGGDRLLEMQFLLQPAKTATENHDPGSDRRLLGFAENIAEPKTVNKP